MTKVFLGGGGGGSVYKSSENMLKPMTWIFQLLLIQNQYIQYLKMSLEDTKIIECFYPKISVIS